MAEMTEENQWTSPCTAYTSIYTIYNVNEPAELMEFLMKKMAGISRTRVKALLSNRVVLVDNNIQTQYNYPLKPGMKVQISKEKNKHEFRHPLLKILYEDAYLIVVEKKEGLLSVATDKQKNYCTAYPERVCKTPAP